MNAISPIKSGIIVKLVTDITIINNPIMIKPIFIVLFVMIIKEKNGYVFKTL